MTGWFDELEFDPSVSWRRMATRALGERPWLVSDESGAWERALRRDLLERVRDEVFAAAPRPVGAEVRALVGAHVEVAEDADRDPLAAAGLAVQEDLCLLRLRDGAWHLDAAFLCFPSRWRLADKIRRPLVDVHAPTPGYREHLAPRVDRLLGRLGDRPVLRRNWFVHPDPSLHQPQAPAVDPVVDAHEVPTSLHLRSERQTLRRLMSGWVLFTIRVQHRPLGDLLADARHRDRFRRYVAGAPIDDLAHRGMAFEQVRELCVTLGIPSRVPKSDTTSDL